VRIRFIAQDLAGESIVEAGVDDVEIDAVGLLGADAEGPSAPLLFGLGQNRPNPFRLQTSIVYTLDRASQASLAVYDISGRVVRTLADGMAQAGVHTAVWDGRDDAGRSVPSGIYLLRVRSEAGTQTRKMILVE
jgi:flagellar hook assembly protein FlgD